MKVIVANYRYFLSGGPERYMFNFMEAAKRKGIEVIPFSVNNPQNKETEYSKYFAKPRAKETMYSDTKKTLGNLWGMIRASTWNFDAERRLRKLIQATEADVVYILHEVNHLSPSIIRAAKKERVRVVHRISDFFMFCPKYDFLCENDICEACIHGNYSKALAKRCVKGSIFGTMLRVFGMKIYNWTNVFDDVDFFVSTCEFSKNKLIEGGINGKKIVCIPTFIDYLSVLPIYKNDNYFLFCGRMSHQKGTIYAVKAMSYLLETDYKLKITGVIGESEEDKEIWNYIVENHLEDKIEFTGFVHGKKLDELISRCTAVLCPAIWYENMPNVLIESYAHGKPVIASDIGCFKDLVFDNETGFLFMPKNSRQLAEKMMLYVNDKQLTVRHGKNARAYCEEYFDESSHMEKLLEIFE